MQVYDGKQTNQIQDVRLDGIQNLTFLKACIFLDFLGDNKILSSWRDIRSNLFYKAIVRSNKLKVKVISVGVEIWPKMELHNQLVAQLKNNSKEFLQVMHQGQLKAITRKRDQGEDDDKKERNVSINQRFKLAEMVQKKKKSKEDYKFTPILLSRVSFDNHYFIMRLARNMNQCIHVDISEKRKMQEEGEHSDEEEDSGGLGSMFQKKDKKKTTSGEDEEEVVPHKIQQIKYHLVVGQMDSFLYEHEKLFQLNPDRTISPVINQKLIIGAENDEDKTLVLLNMDYEENDDKKLTFPELVVPKFVNFSIYYREFEFEGYLVVLERMQKRLNYAESCEHVVKKGARLMTLEEIKQILD